MKTLYKGRRFRSHIEARWAVYFDALGLLWEYEKTEFDFGLGYVYRPDFWLQDVRMWAAVTDDRMPAAEEDLCRALVRRTGFPCLKLEGVPEVRHYYAFELFEGRIDLMDYLLTNFHGYPKSEHRFYGSTGMNDAELQVNLDYFDDLVPAVQSSRTARFEYWV